MFLFQLEERESERGGGGERSGEAGRVYTRGKERRDKAKQDMGARWEGCGGYTASWQRRGYVGDRRVGSFEMAIKLGLVG